LLAYTKVVNIKITNSNRDSTNLKDSLDILLDKINNFKLLSIYLINN